MLRRRSSDCGPLLEFEEVRRRLHLGTRRDLGVQEIAVAQIIGSVSRAHEFDGCFRPLTDRLRKVLAEIKRAKPNAADSAIAVYQVDHAYFVVDGHKRLSLAVEEGREAIDAEVGRFASRFHVASGTTMEDIRATERENRFRQVTGLDSRCRTRASRLARPTAISISRSRSRRTHTTCRRTRPCRAARGGRGIGTTTSIARRSGTRLGRRRSVLEH